MSSGVRQERAALIGIGDIDIGNSLDGTHGLWEPVAEAVRLD
jgi:hypothetical protein